MLSVTCDGSWMKGSYAGARRSNTVKNNTSQNIVYTVFTGNSAAVNKSGKRET
jgi:hypothetical protein